jgi:hypothetical protein
MVVIERSPDGSRHHRPQRASRVPAIAPRLENNIIIVEESTEMQRVL